ncbi:MAG: threonine ammonia-lyase [Planctomycetes bacterium]|nr:threonine ammonia-lyase [Planctomycetota bacterium]
MQRHDDLFAKIREAADRIAPYIHETPLVYSHTLSASLGFDVHFKAENLQRAGSFKIRGALNKILSLDESERRRGVIASSAGNHAQGVALAAQMFSVPATIVMPADTALVKYTRTREYGAHVILQGSCIEDAYAKAREIQAAENQVFIHPYDDARIVEGQGTLGLEIVRELADVTDVIVPLGGGGLLAGVAVAVKSARPSVRVTGVQSAAMAPIFRAFRGGDPAGPDRGDTIADGIKVKATGAITLPLIRDVVDDVVLVEDEEIIDAIVMLIEKSRLVVEGAGAVGVAALLARKATLAGRHVCVVLSGGNIDTNRIARIIEAGLVSVGRQTLIRTRVRDVPGQLHRVLEVLASHQANVLDVQHHRAGWKVPIGWVDIEILVETRYAEQRNEILAILASQGFTLLE